MPKLRLEGPLSTAARSSAHIGRHGFPNSELGVAATAEFAQGVAIVGRHAQEFESVAHSISVPQPRVEIDFLSWPGHANYDALSDQRDLALDHRPNASLAEACGVSVQQNGVLGVWTLHQNDREVDFNSGKRAYAVKLLAFTDLTHKIRGPSQIPIVMDMIGLTSELVANRSFARAAGGKLFAAYDDRFMRRAVTRGMLHEINAAYRRKFARLTH